MKQLIWKSNKQKTYDDDIKCYAFCSDLKNTRYLAANIRHFRKPNYLRVNVFSPFKQIAVKDFFDEGCGLAALLQKAKKYAESKTDQYLTEELIKS
jgi:hypothetical protein